MQCEVFDIIEHNYQIPMGFIFVNHKYIGEETILLTAWSDLNYIAHSFSFRVLRLIGLTGVW